jgi:cytochrome P450
MATATRPPGPKGQFLVGTGAEFARDPLAFLARCRGYGDLVRVRFLHIPVFMIHKPALIETVLVTDSSKYVKSMDLRESRNVLGNGLLTSEGEFWRRQRGLAQPAFHRERIAAYARVITDFAEQMLSGWKDGEARDIHRDMMRLALEIAAKTLFGADIADEAREIGSALHVVLKQFQARSHTAFLIPPYLPTPLNLRARKAVRSLDEIVYGIIRKRRANSSSNGDLLSMLLKAQDEDGNRMTDQQLRDESITLLLAGHETTAIALSWTWYLLAQNPNVEAKLLTELRATLGGRPPAFEDLPRLQCTDKVVRESMRLYPPAWVIGREAATDCEIAGYLVPAGAQMYMSQWVMHRDPRYFDEPERFHPDRWTPEFSKRLPKFAYFPFGGGPRVCIGAAFAMMEATLLLATIAQRFRVSLLSAERVEPWPSVTLRPRNGVHVVVTRR